MKILIIFNFNSNHKGFYNSKKSIGETELKKNFRPKINSLVLNPKWRKFFLDLIQVF